MPSVVVHLRFRKLMSTWIGLNTTPYIRGLGCAPSSWAECLLCIIDNAIVLDRMVQPDVQDFEEDRVLSADTGDWPEFRDKESCQLLWDTTCDCAKPFMCANIRGLSTKVGVDRSPEQHMESWYSIFVQFSGKSVRSWRLVELLAACSPLNSFKVHWPAQEGWASFRDFS